MGKNKDLKVTMEINGQDVPIDLDEMAAMQKQMQAQASRYEIRKASLKKNMFLVVSYRNVGAQKTTVDDCEKPVHNDLKDAFAQLDQHMTELCRQYDENGSLEHDECYCSGFSLSSDNTKVTLNGGRRFEDGKAITLTSPQAKFEDHGDIEHAISVIKNECLLFLFEGKCAPEQQLGLFDDETTEDPELVSDEVSEF